MSPATPQVSYRDLAPLERGGVIARNGFEFQDHVAARYCIDMLNDDSLIEVWCETLDDITLVRLSGDDEIFEFVQVKSNRFDHLWSIAEFCKQESIKENKKTVKKANSSIFEKLFANERAEAKEKCLFRMVTAFDVNNDLKILTYPLSSPLRTLSNSLFCDLCDAIGKNLPNYSSSTGSNVTSCLSRTVWDVLYDDKSVQNANLRVLSKAISSFGNFLVEDQLIELYKKVLGKVKEAGRADWNIDPALKKITRQVFVDWIKTEINLAKYPSSGGTGNKLREKMLKAGIPEDVIENALKQRRFYRSQSLNQEYMNLSKREEVEMLVIANLQQLISELDSEKLKVDGVGFHSICLNRLQDISSNKQDVSLPFLYGFMYYMTERCVYRFIKIGA
ncbi:MAG: DUF4297 domain-containing protein [Pseudanabaena sp. M57BS1SP1A06MG]|nr:DUF4297 domain-containing protein [Pseudanabaena sp. M53BS1SP1A06MG]MCA6584721.1 DUF4297 domain-containing protein [Pseudanabaena sp. M34BS1SP1A06MG]MCA6594536.1 DUF4297 domain-containing protein [Pseudanabaena sp. M38BS1SP1A06MG]MCA6601595.1 DUF4297 domain-containing protein [Pseudanabaena sp. M57BS1SP1A06MG]